MTGGYTWHLISPLWHRCISGRVPAEASHLPVCLNCPGCRILILLQPCPTAYTQGRCKAPQWLTTYPDGFCWVTPLNLCVHQSVQGRTVPVAFHKQLVVEWRADSSWLDLEWRLWFCDSQYSHTVYINLLLEQWVISILFQVGSALLIKLFFFFSLRELIPHYLFPVNEAHTHKTYHTRTCMHSQQFAVLYI